MLANSTAAETSKTHERVKREIREQEELLLYANEEREERGVHLHGAQQQLSRFKLKL